MGGYYRNFKSYQQQIYLKFNQITAMIQNITLEANGSAHVMAWNSTQLGLAK